MHASFCISAINNYRYSLRNSVNDVLVLKSETIPILMQVYDSTQNMSIVKKYILVSTTKQSFLTKFIHNLQNIQIKREVIVNLITL